MLVVFSTLAAAVRYYSEINSAVVMSDYLYRKVKARSDGRHCGPKTPNRFSVSLPTIYMQGPHRENAALAGTTVANYVRGVSDVPGSRRDDALDFPN